MSSEHATIAAHIGAGAAVFGTLAGLLPPLAALGAVIWYAIEIYESKTVQEWLGKRKTPRDSTGNPDDTSDPPGVAG